jgi:AbrB family looped-hinge helix DNA binding protein
MARKTATTPEQIGRVGHRRQIVIPVELFKTLNVQEGDLLAFTQQPDGVLIKPKRAVDPDDVLTPPESALIAKARREMREGKYVALTQLEHDMARKRQPKRRKTA